MEPISAVMLIRTDTTLDHSQKAEKVCIRALKQTYANAQIVTPVMASGSISENDQESHRLRDLQAIFCCLLKPTIPPLSTPSDFACSVSSLGRCSLHYPPGGSELPLKPPYGARPWTRMDSQRSRCRIRSRRIRTSLIWLPLGIQDPVTGPSSHF